MGQSNELDQEPTGEVAQWNGDKELTPGIIQADEETTPVVSDASPDFQEVAEDLNAEKDKHGATLVRENILLAKIEKVAAALTSDASMHEKLEAVYVALHG